MDVYKPVFSGVLRQRYFEMSLTAFVCGLWFCLFVFFKVGETTIWPCKLDLIS